MKKLLALLTCLCLLASVMFVSAANGVSKDSPNKRQLTEEEVFESLASTYNDSKLMSAIDQSELTQASDMIQGFHSQDYSDYTNGQYAGMYLNENGDLIICYVNNSDALEQAKKKLSKSTILKNESKDVVAESVTVKNVTYSYEELLNANEKLIGIWDQYKDIYKFGIDVENNNIKVEIVSGDSADKTEKDLKALFDDGILNIVRTDKKIGDVKVKTSISGVTQINNGSNTASAAGTMYSSSRGVNGVISCAHGGFTVGKSIYKNPGTTQRLGSITQSVLSTTNDASFIELSAGNSYTPYGSALSDSISSNVPVVGSYVTLRGGVSGTTSAKVLSNSQSVRVDADGTIINATDHIEINRAVNYGDSGGGALSGTIDGGRTNCVVGIIRAGDSYGSFLVKGNYVLNAFR